MSLCTRLEVGSVGENNVAVSRVGSVVTSRYHGGDSGLGF